jgi:1,4-dihydroxy-2-naphthoate octaprenyltransferase
MNGIALSALAFFFLSSLEIKEFTLLSTCLLPVLVYFIVWAVQVWRNPSRADFRNTMNMNIIASCCTSIGFILAFLMNYRLNG